jgi:hypothetical protein
MDVEQKISEHEMNRRLMEIGLDFKFVIKYKGKRHPDGVWYIQPKWFSSCCGGCTFEEGELEKKERYTQNGNYLGFDLVCPGSVKQDEDWTCGNIPLVYLAPNTHGYWPRQHSIDTWAKLCLRSDGKIYYCMARINQYKK